VTSEPSGNVINPLLQALPPPLGDRLRSDLLYESRAIEVRKNTRNAMNSDGIVVNRFDFKRQITQHLTLIKERRDLLTGQPNGLWNKELLNVQHMLSPRGANLIVVHTLMGRVHVNDNELVSQFTHKITLEKLSNVTKVREPKRLLRRLRLSHVPRGLRFTKERGLKWR
jgi:hypothetical protein